MPEKYRLISDEIKTLINKRNDFEIQLQTAITDLSELQKGDSIDALVNQQNRIQAIESLMRGKDAEIETMQAELTVEKEKAKRKAIIRRICEIDEKAEQAAAQFVEIYSDVENLSYQLFLQLVILKHEIFGYKREFHNQIRILFPNINQLTHEDLPELRCSLDAFLEELKANNGCALGILRAESFSDFRYVTDDYHAFNMPEHSLTQWIKISMGMIEAHLTDKARHEQNKAQKKMTLPNQDMDYPPKTIQKKFSEKIPGIILLRRIWE